MRWISWRLWIKRILDTRIKMISIHTFSEYLTLIHIDKNAAVARALGSQDAQAINSACRDFALAVLVKRNICLHLQNVATLTYIFITVPTYSAPISQWLFIMPAAKEPAVNSGRNSPKPAPKRIWTLNEPPFEGFKPIDADGFRRSDKHSAIVVDMGQSSHLLFDQKDATIFC